LNIFFGFGEIADEDENEPIIKEAREAYY